MKHIITLLAVVLACALPQFAFAKSYTMPQVDIDASIDADGTLHVDEVRTFSFDGSFSCVWWELNLDEFEVDAVRFGMGEAGTTGDLMLYDIMEVPFDTLWRTEGGPGFPSYSIDWRYSTVYVFFTAMYETDRIELSYSVPAGEGLVVYDDVAELYWQYLGDGWAVDSRNVDLDLSLPVPPGVAPQPGEDVRAWGHGSLDGRVTWADDGSTVNFHLPVVEAGEFAEARVTFPAQWVSGAPASAHADGSGLEQILTDEQRDADRANARRALASAIQVGFLGLMLLVPGALVVVSLVVFLRHGREHKPQFQERYWRDVPQKGTHPALIARVWRFGSQSYDDFTATLLHLSNLGVVQIAQGTYADKEGRPVRDYYVTLRDESLATDPIDKRLVKMLFGTIAKNRNAFWLAEIKQYGDKHPKSFKNAVDAWQGAVSKEVDARAFFEPKGEFWRWMLVMLGAFAIVGGIFLTMWMENFLPLLTALSGLVALVFAIFMPRRSPEAADIHARCRALRNWLKEFSLLDERPPLDVKVWGEFMVYAYILGVAKEAIAQLRATWPQVFEQEDAFARGHDWYVPWYAYYDSGFSSQSGSTFSFAEAFDTAWTNTASSVNAALSASEGGSGGGWSSGGGGGGGFSGGGGGGFGGGGGGAR